MQAIASKLSNAARARVRDRLRGRPRVPLSGLITGQATTTEPTNDTALAHALAGLIGVDAEHLRPNDRFREIFRVHRDELPQDIQPLMPKAGLNDVIDPFAFALLDFVEKRIGDDRSRLQRAAFVPSPKNENEWIDRILDMTFAEFLIALA